MWNLLFTPNCSLELDIILDLGDKVLGPSILFCLITDTAKTSDTSDGELVRPKVFFVT